MSPLLHESNLARVPLFGRWLRRQLVNRVNETRDAATGKDPDVSVVIRAKNSAAQLEDLLADIRRQEYGGDIEIIVVDTESTDETVAVAKRFGATIVRLKQADFSYPKALNLGFSAATKPWIFSIVDHSALSNRYVLKAATRWDPVPEMAAAWAFGLPNANATFWEQYGYLLKVGRQLAEPAHRARVNELGAGLLAANDVLVRRSAWKAAGGFDESYGAGGEDSAFGRVLIRKGYHLIYDPGISVYHTHGLGLIANVRQILYWRRLAKPLDFNLDELKKYRSDL